ncbi:MAG TPA: PQQ-dependent sugar dehydrogenase [Rhodocyclaceae bacterium]|nr:PQQ-dependent sugar dehydrogenase [Rhodocyclaceae bacterium]
MKNPAESCLRAAWPHFAPSLSGLALSVALLAACGGGGAASNSPAAATPPATDPASSSSSASSSAVSLAAVRCDALAAAQTSPSVSVTQAAGGLVNPWGMVFLPDGRMLVTERPGRIRIVSTAGVLSAPITGVPPVYAQGQGGLLDIALDPNYASNGLIYFSYAESGTGGAGTAVARATLNTTTLALSGLSIIYRQTPKVSGGNHFGSRLVFGTDGKLYVSLGERFQFTPAQDTSQSLGKIVRINSDGSVPTDNPFVGNSSSLPEIWTLGHRNPQGMTRHPMTGQLWTAEHGAMGGDEINKPEKGKNYGWPVISYGVNYDGTKIGEGTAKLGMEQPRCYWDPSIAPGNLVFYTGNKVASWSGNLFVAALKDMSLMRLTLNGTTITGQERINIGKRVRDVRVGPDGWLYLLTDETAGQILRLSAP